MDVLEGPLRDRSKLVVIQSEPQLATWPISTQWGRLRWIDVDSGEAEAGVDPLPLDVSLWPGERADNVYVFNPGMLQLYEARRGTDALQALTPKGMSITDASVSADGKTIAAIVESADSPGHVQVWTSHSRKWHALRSGRIEWRSPGRLPIEHVQWHSADDLFVVDGFVAKPVDFDPRKKYPLIVLLKGGNAQGTYPFENRFDPFFGGGEVGGPPVSVYTAAGYVVLMPNHRVTESAPVQAAQAVIGQYGQHVTLDVEAGIDFLIEKGWVDGSQIGIYGQSHGGDEVAYAISNSRRFKAAVINDSPVMLPEHFVPSTEANSILVPWYGRKVMSHLIGFDVMEKPWVDPAKIYTPLLLRWGSSGRPNWPAQPLSLATGWNMANQAGVAQTERLIEALERNDVAIEVLVDRDEHQIVHYDYMLEWQSRLLQWFDFFVRGQGDNPLPAMKSPIDYSKLLKEVLGEVRD